ncbi:MAG: LacI family DNA-binding transcriptional regulator [Clostridia bacterium]|nr:LacI family DNA-binding transcriptional regulator [Clostridia bacterium]
MAATMKDLSRETGLGLATISKYFNGGTVREKNRVLIEAAVKKLHYVPNEVARSLKTQHSRVIGVVIPELSNAFITSIISTMEDILRKHDYAVIVCDCRSDVKREKEAVEFLMHRRVDGLINMATDTSGSHLKAALSAGIPVLLIDRLIDSLRGKVSAVVIDNVHAAGQAVQKLTKLGHRQIGLVLGSPNLFTTNQRLHGYLDALREAGITPSEQYIRYGDYTLDGGYQAVLDLLSLRERPTALFVTNFEMTLGAMLALQHSGVRIPEDLSVIGFDKLELFGEIFPDLTLIRQPQLSIGREAASLMLDLVGSGNSVSHRIVTLSTELAEGKSVRVLKP